MSDAGRSTPHVDAAQMLQIGEFRLDPDTGELRGPRGSERLDPKVMAVLILLARHAGAVVAREKFLDSIWPGMVVTDDVLSRCIYQLRGHFRRTGGDDAYKRLVQTLPKRGYRLNPTVAGPEQAADGTGRDRYPGGLPTRNGQPPKAGRRHVRAEPLLGRAAIVLLTLAAVAAPVLFGMLQRNSSAPAPRDDAVADDTARLNLAHPHPKAEEHYLQAKYFHNRRGPGDIERARHHYEQAVAVDPDHARAWVGLAGIYAVLVADLETVAFETGVRKLGDAAKRAVALDPHMPTAHARLSQYLSLIGDRRGADAALRTALDQHPEDALTLAVAAGAAASAGRWDDAVRLQRRAVARDPVSAASRSNLVNHLLRAGRPDEAHEELLILQKLIPDWPFGGFRGLLQLTADVLVLTRRYDEAALFVERWPEGNDRARYLAMIYHALGRTAESDALIRQQTMPPQRQDSVNMSEVHAFRGEPDQAFRWLTWTTRTFAAPEPFPYRRLVVLRELRFSPYLRPLHDDPRWTVWLTSVGDLGPTPASPPAQRSTSSTTSRG